MLIYNILYTEYIFIVYILYLQWTSDVCYIFNSLLYLYLHMHTLHKNYSSNYVSDGRKSVYVVPRTTHICVRLLSACQIHFTGFTS